MNALQKFSIFKPTEPTEFERLPVKPVRTERPFGDPERPIFSGDAIKSRIDQIVRDEGAEDSASVRTAYRDTILPDTSAEPVSPASRKVDRLLDLPRKPAPLFFTSTFNPVQEWEGYVREIGSNSISADLVDITARSKRITEQAEIPLEELSDGDRERLKLGAVFRWSIGYQRASSGSKMRVSHIVFRDLPRWTARDLREAKSEAETLEHYFKEGRPNLPSPVEPAKEE
ncbi:hypothetical protein JQ615_12030 [Bradyrhizobium jicamae]|uniref:Uncharacterized protein n=1 Tax=Bradyrhizobium jicamae TaxID=280332 RepID=A0ABS5FH74_9BRAD|nr:hypothetical protein [Bradyrhizobium jicamae]MBR0796118.1 hypothetical protein [Bradyrhizobium jicamae]